MLRRAQNLFAQAAGNGAWRHWNGRATTASARWSAWQRGMLHSFEGIHAAAFAIERSHVAAAEDDPR